MIIVKNATVVEFNPPRVEADLDIVISGSKIIAVGKGIATDYQADRVLDMRGALVMPGLVCSHNHFYSGLARGITANIPPSADFISILKNLWWRLDVAIDEEILYYSGMVCALEAIRSGTTTVIDHHASPSFIKGSLHVIKKAFEEVGLRGITCYETTDRNGGMREVEACIQENVDFAKGCQRDKENKKNDYLVEAMIGGHAPVTMPDSALKLMAEAVNETKRGVHIHVAEDSYDVSHSHHRYGKDVMKRLTDCGLINEKSLLVHGVYLSDQDITMINERDAFLAHNARSNMNNHVGYNNKLSLYKNLVLGTDGMGSDMFEEMKFAFFKHKDAGGPLWPDGYLQFLSKGNELVSRYFDAQFGRIAPGYKADLTVLDYQSPTPLVAENIGGHLIFGVTSRDVKTVIVNGRIVLENREFTFDVNQIYRKAQQVSQRLWDRMDGCLT